MNPHHRFFARLGVLPWLRPLALRLLPAALGVWMLSAQAGEGHDHGTAAPATAVAALPRFAASSELFELVGVLKDRQLTLYLDHAASNAPVQDARLTLDLGGRKLTPQQLAPGTFEVTLAAPLAPGVTPVTATVNSPAESDLLAGEFDLHEDAHPEPAHSWADRGWLLAAGLGFVALLALALRRWRHRRAVA